MKTYLNSIEKVTLQNPEVTDVHLEIINGERKPFLDQLVLVLSVKLALYRY